MNTFDKILLGIIVILVIIGGFLFIQNNSLKKELNGKTVEVNSLQQNLQAYKDSSEMLAKKIQDYAIFVKDLKYVNSTLYTQNNILKTKFRILLDSVVVLNQAAQVDTNDNMIVVRFEGYQGKINYKGKVVYFKLTNKG